MGINRDYGEKLVTTVQADRGVAVPPMRFAVDGAELFPGAARYELAALRDLLSTLPTDAAGVRIHAVAALRSYIDARSSIGAVAAGALGPEARPVRAILFDKTPATNWALGWHQDRTICVRRRVDVAGFGPWTVKQRLNHVAPPFDVLRGMVTLRVHLDDAGEDNAPLMVALGSHAHGPVPVDRVAAVVTACGVGVCTASAGDVSMYATPILHASDAARRPTHRRVLQLDYAATALPGGLEWLGV